MLAANTEPPQQNRLSVTGRQDRYLDTGREIILKYIQYDQNNSRVDVVLNSRSRIFLDRCSNKMKKKKLYFCLTLLFYVYFEIQSQAGLDLV